MAASVAITGNLMKSHTPDLLGKRICKNHTIGCLLNDMFIHKYTAFVG